MTDGIQSLIETYGLVAVFLGCVAEGETAAVLGGFFAHQHVFEPWHAYLATFLGAFTGDSLLFLAGRRFSGHPFVARLRGGKATGAALALVDRHPHMFVLANRYAYGMRMAGGVIAGLSRIPASHFFALNALSAAVWAAIFGAAGYFLGATAEQVFGAALHDHQRLIVAAAIAGVALALGLVVVRRRAGARRDDGARI